MPTEVRILPSPSVPEPIRRDERGSSSGGRARAFQARGRGFDSRLPLVASCAHVAQAVEHFLGKEEVTGSNPVVGSPGQATAGAHTMRDLITLGLRRLQAEELHQHEEQEEDDGEARASASSVPPAGATSLHKEGKV